MSHGPLVIGVSSEISSKISDFRIEGNEWEWNQLWGVGVYE